MGAHHHRFHGGKAAAPTAPVMAAAVARSRGGGVLAMGPAYRGQGVLIVLTPAGAAGVYGASLSDRKALPRVV